MKADYRERGLTAPCCGVAVVPVRSPTGWQFFRHTPNALCTARESLAHIVCKSILARTADRLGLAVTTEARADDGRWVADVLVRHPGWTVALEAQISRIPMAAIEARQVRYREHGIRGAWLVGYDVANVAARRDLPLFRLEVGPAARPDPAVVGAGGRVALERFTALLLTGRVRFAGPPAAASAPSVASVPSVCWKCRRDIDLVVALVNLPAHAVFAPRGIVSARDLGKLPEALAAYRRAMPRLHTVCGALPPLRRPPPSRVAVGLRAHCPWCDAPISLHALPDATRTPRHWHRCWTLDGQAWAPSEPRAARWTWSDPGSDPGAGNAGRSDRR
ncbi:competence protein CoiA family protein [Azospirillum soli]|uniref:competence protein CoiA family protein n=1 Tax=Azospirillum soli TaxID=1304799 RepID=UPI001AEA41DE|nr:competence protein CoiA family protein [Azospirillum soli]